MVNQRSARHRVKPQVRGRVKGLGHGVLPSSVSEAATFIAGQRDAGTVLPGARATNVMNAMRDAGHLELDTVAYSPGEEPTGDRIEASPDGDAAETKLFSVPPGEMELTRPSLGAAEGAVRSQLYCWIGYAAFGFGRTYPQAR